MDDPEDRSKAVVRFCPKSTHRCCVPARPLRATSGCERSQQEPRLFDHLVGARKKCWRDDKSKHLRGSYLVGACTGRSAGFFALEDAVDVACSAPQRVGPVVALVCFQLVQARLCVTIKVHRNSHTKAN